MNKQIIYILAFIMTVYAVTAINIFKLDTNITESFEADCGIQALNSVNESNNTYTCIPINVSGNGSIINVTNNITINITNNITINETNPVVNFTIDSSSVDDNIFLCLLNGTCFNATISDNTASNLRLDQILNPAADTNFNMNGFGINFTFTGALADGMTIEGIGALTDDLLHIHQHTGNVGNIDLVHIQAEDPDALPLNLTTVGAWALRTNGNISASWIWALINASYIQNPYWLNTTDQRYNDTGYVNNRSDSLQTNISNVNTTNNIVNLLYPSGLKVLTISTNTTDYGDTLLSSTTKHGYVLHQVYDDAYSGSLVLTSHYKIFTSPDTVSDILTIRTLGATSNALFNFTGYIQLRNGDLNVLNGAITSGTSITAGSSISAGTNITVNNVTGNVCLNLACTSYITNNGTHLLIR